MATDDQAPKEPSKQELDTAEFGAALQPPGGVLLKDRYLLVRQLNEGGFGTVHLAQDQQMHGRLVVVKIQLNQRVDDPWFERKFSEEVRALSMIDHPSVVVAIDSGRTPDGKPFLVMQYVDGVTLRAAMNPEGMPLDRAAAILKQVGHGLGAAHDKGIWHRDLKPENLMLQNLGESGERVRLIDFGIATVADIKNKYQTTTRVAGSILYMAPEQAIGQPSALTDIYAMGLIAYEMVTGRKPFIAENAVQLAGLQRAGVKVKPSHLRPNLPLAAERLILRSLEYEPSKRPRNARVLGDELYEALLDTAATRITSPAHAEPGNVRTKWIAGVAAALALVSAVAYGLHKAQPEPQKAAPVKQEVRTPDANAESAVELGFWNSVKDSTEPQLYREYLHNYPEGKFASLAKLKLDILAKKAPPKTAAAPVKADSGARDQEIELVFWNSVKDSTEPQLYQNYIETYPHGRFVALAKTKLEMFGRNRGKAGRAQRNFPIPDISDLTNLALNPKMTAELADWAALKDVTDPQAYRDYLTKYPGGMFSAVARIKISASERGSRPPDNSQSGDSPLPPHPPNRVVSGREPHPVPPLRAAIDIDDYRGPQQGELHWSGTLPEGRTLLIQGGRANFGEIVNGLPRVPVTLELLSKGVRIQNPPSPNSNWDRLILKNVSDSSLTEVVIRWKVAK